MACVRVPPEKLCLHPPHPGRVPLPRFWQLPPRLSRRSWYRQIYRDLIFRGIYLLAGATFLLGLPRSIRLAERVGRWAFAWKKRERERTLSNLAMSLGDRVSQKERREIARRVFSHAAVTAVETIWMSRWPELVTWLEIEIEGEEHLKEAEERGKGVILFGGHFGNWEVQGAVIVQTGHWGYPVVRPLKDPRLEDWIDRVRKACGLHSIKRGKTPFQLVRALKKGEILAIVIDLDTRSARGVFVDFFGRPAYTPTGAFELARLTGAALVPSMCYREGLNRMRICFGQPWEIVPSQDAETDILRAAQKATGYLEERIRERPEQWMWFHNRWKTQPDHFQRKGRPLPPGVGP